MTTTSVALGFEAVERAVRVLRERLGSIPPTAVVLGSGLGGFTDRLASAVTLSCREVPGWPVPAVIGHAGRIVSGTCAGRQVLVLAGRVHLYEGRSAAEVAFAVRVLGRAGVRSLVLTNAAGGINPSFAPGTLMVIDDHLNCTGTNPLVGPNDTRFGPRFPDMTEVYSRRLRAIADKAARDAGVPVTHGVYAGVLGPSYETPAEIRALRTCGADAVGMSTVTEAIVARHMGMEVLGLSCISNPAAGLNTEPLSEADVLAAAAAAEGAFTRLLEAILVRL